VPDGSEITAKEAIQAKTLVTYSNIMNVTRSQRTSSSSTPDKKSLRTKTVSNADGSVAAPKGKSKKTVLAHPSSEQVALRAYFIGERRRTLGIPGDETSDWVAAEKELLKELKSK
jgi:hypothetical protein